jgi:hypothetical protein
MSMSPALNERISVRDAYLAMFVFLERYWERTGRSDDLGSLLGELALWQTESGGREPMDAAVLPEWLQCVASVVANQSAGAESELAAVTLDGFEPNLEVKR